MNEKKDSAGPAQSAEDFALTREMVRKAPPWMAGTAGILRVLLRDSVWVVIALGSLITALYTSGARKTDDQIGLATEQLTELRLLRSDLTALRGDLDTVKTSVLDLYDRSEAVFEDHPKSRKRYEQRRLGGR